jgi:hypothetical protein
VLELPKRPGLHPLLSRIEALHRWDLSADHHYAGDLDIATWCSVNDFVMHYLTADSPVPLHLPNVGASVL